MWSYTQCTPGRLPRGVRPGPAARSAYDSGVTVVVRDEMSIAGPSTDDDVYYYPLRGLPQDFGVP